MDNSRREHNLALHQAHLQRLRVLEQQAATFGAHAPPHLLTELSSLRQQITALSNQITPVAPRILRYPIADFLGREAETNWIVEAISQAVSRMNTAVCRVCGMGGIGKTELAFGVAQRLTSLFPDGQI